jgi:PST family polysaccharide transporter
MANIAISNITAKLLAVPGIFIFVKQDTDIWLACFINGLTFLFAGLIGLIIVYKKSWIQWITPKWSDMWNEYKNAWHIFISTAAINIYTSSITVMLGIMTSPTMVGYFVAADKIRLAIQGLIGPVSQALYPRINSLIISNRKKAFETINILLKVQGGSALLLSFFIFVFSDKIIVFMYGDNYTESIVIMKILAWLPFIVAVSNVFGYQTLLVLSMDKVFSKIVLVGAISALGLIYPMVTMFDNVGAAITILVTELIVNQLMLVVILYKKIPIFCRMS